MATVEEIRRWVPDAERAIKEKEAALLAAARELGKAEQHLRQLQERCPHPNKTTRDGGWQGTATIIDCPDCKYHRVSD